MGLAGCPVGFVFGFISTAFGILLVARGVPVGRVLAVSATAFSPTWWAWTLGPVLDVRFTRKFYAVVLALLTAVLLAATVLSLHHLPLFTVLLTASCTTGVMYSNALNGWAPDLVTDGEYDTFSAWINVANLGAAGVFSGLAVLFVRTLPLPTAAALLGTLTLLPALLLLGYPPAPRPAGTLRDNFAAMTRDLRRVLRQGRVWVGLVLFLSPASCFALTNAWSSLGAEFGAGERLTTWLNGPGVAAVCAAGSLLAIPLLRRFRRRTLYLAAGFLAAISAAAAAVLPHTPVVFAVCLLVYNMAQGFNFTAFVALCYEIIGVRNALAATMMSVLYASGNLPISLMTAIEGRLHDTHGLRTMLLTDTLTSVVAAALLFLLVLPWLDRGQQPPEISLAAG